MFQNGYPEDGYIKKSVIVGIQRYKEWSQIFIAGGSSVLVKEPLFEVLMKEWVYGNEGYIGYKAGSL